SSGRSRSGGSAIAIGVQTTEQVLAEAARFDGGLEVAVRAAMIRGGCTRPAVAEAAAEDAVRRAGEELPRGRGRGGRLRGHWLLSNVFWLAAKEGQCYRPASFQGGDTHACTSQHDRNRARGRHRIEREGGPVRRVRERSGAAARALA